MPQALNPMHWAFKRLDLKFFGSSPITRIIVFGY